MKPFAATLLLALTATASADEINLSVTGSVDPGVVATSIATELARPIAPQPPHAACKAPCLAIAVAGRSATVTFTTATGGTRQRTIELGGDRAQWIELVTLLAGNLVRDDAEELLPADSQPTVVEPPAPPVEPPPALEIGRPSFRSRGGCRRAFRRSNRRRRHGL